MKRGQQTIIAIDLLRFACAAMVMAFHYATIFALAPSKPTAAALAGLSVSHAGAGITWSGWIGVELFFVISGYVIATSASGASTAAFLRRRALRLVPAAWLCASVTLAALDTPSALRPWLCSMLFLPTNMQIDPSYWTLGIEIVFYLWIAIGLGRAGDPTRIERRAVALGWWSAAFWLFMLAADVIAVPVGEWRPLQLALLPQGVFFAIGVLAQVIHRDGVTRRRCALLGIFTLAALAEIAARSIERGHATGLSPGPWVPWGIFLTGLALVLAAIRVQPWLARRIAPDVATMLGLLTYPLYLLHQEVGAVLAGAAMRAGLSYWPAITLALAAVLAMSLAIVRVGEPLIRGLLTAPRAPARDTRPSAFPPAG